MSKRDKQHRGLPELQICQVEGCGADLTQLREYHLRYKICEYHLKADYILREGQQQRFCQQCGRFHSLDAFDDQKRSCRERLQKHNARRRRKGANGGSGGEEGGEGGEGAPSAAVATGSGEDGSKGAAGAADGAAAGMSPSFSKRKKNADKLPAGPRSGPMRASLSTLSGYSETESLHDNESLLASHESLEMALMNAGVYGMPGSNAAAGGLGVQPRAGVHAPKNRRGSMTVVHTHAKEVVRRNRLVGRSASHDNLLPRHAAAHATTPSNLARQTSINQGGGVQDHRQEQQLMAHGSGSLAHGNAGGLDPYMVGRFGGGMGMPDQMPFTGGPLDMSPQGGWGGLSASSNGSGLPGGGNGSGYGSFIFRSMPQINTPLTAPTSPSALHAANAHFAQLNLDKASLLPRRSLELLQRPAHGAPFAPRSAGNAGAMMSTLGDGGLPDLGLGDMDGLGPLPVQAPTLPVPVGALKTDSMELEAIWQSLHDGRDPGAQPQPQQLQPSLGLVPGMGMGMGMGMGQEMSVLGAPMPSLLGIAKPASLEAAMMHTKQRNLVSIMQQQQQQQHGGGNASSPTMAGPAAAVAALAAASGSSMNSSMSSYPMHHMQASLNTGMQGPGVPLPEGMMPLPMQGVSRLIPHGMQPSQQVRHPMAPLPLTGMQRQAAVQQRQHLINQLAAQQRQQQETQPMSLGSDVSLGRMTNGTGELSSEALDLLGIPSLGADPGFGSWIIGSTDELPSL